MRIKFVILYGLITNYIETMAIFTTWVKIGSTEYLFNPKCTCSWAGQNFYHNFGLQFLWMVDLNYFVGLFIMGTDECTCTHCVYCTIKPIS